MRQGRRLAASDGFPRRVKSGTKYIVRYKQQTRPDNKWIVRDNDNGGLL
jgi:hypothetical protein